MEQLRGERDANRAAFKSESAQRAKEVAQAWRDVNLTKKVKEQIPTTSDEASPSAAPDGTPLSPLGETPSGGSGTPIGETTNAVVGSASQIRNITVNIDAFNKGGINIGGNSQGEQDMDAHQLESWFNEMLLRTIRNLELSQ